MDDDNRMLHDPMQCDARELVLEERGKFVWTDEMISTMLRLGFEVSCIFERLMNEKTNKQKELAWCIFAAALSEERHGSKREAAQTQVRQDQSGAHQVRAKRREDGQPGAIGAAAVLFAGFAGVIRGQGRRGNQRDLWCK